MTQSENRQTVVHLWAGSGGGVWTFIKRLVPHQRERHEVMLVSVARGGAREDVVEDANRLFDRTHFVRKPKFPGIYYLRPVDIRRAVEAVGLPLDPSNAIYHFHAGPLTPLVWHADWEKIGGSSVVTFNGSRGNFHDTSRLAAPRRLLHARAVRRMQAAGVRLVAVSHQSAADCATMYGVPVDVFDVVFNGVDRGGASGDTERCRPDGRFHVGFLGTVQPIKGWRKVVDATELLRERGIDAVCTVVGDGIDFEELRQTAATRAWLAAPGYVRDASSKYLPDFDVLVLPSDFEGLPLVLAEAMSHGVPCVCSEVGGNAEAIRHDREGFLLQERSASEIAAYLQQLAGDAAIRDRMSRNCAARHRMLFTAENTAEAYERIYAGERYRQPLDGPNEA